MRLVVAGGRALVLSPFLVDCITQVVCGLQVTELITHGADGLAAAIIRLAEMNNIRHRVFTANTDKYGPAAARLCNKEIAAYVDAAIVLPGDALTDNLHREAVQADLLLYDWRDLKAT